MILECYIIVPQIFKPFFGLISCIALIKFIHFFYFCLFNNHINLGNWLKIDKKKPQPFAKNIIGTWLKDKKLKKDIVKQRRGTWLVMNSNFRFGVNYSLHGLLSKMSNNERQSIYLIFKSKRLNLFLVLQIFQTINWIKLWYYKWNYTITSWMLETKIINISRCIGIRQGCFLPLKTRVLDV